MPDKNENTPNQADQPSSPGTAGVVQRIQIESDSESPPELDVVRERNDEVCEIPQY